jgi:hypothetical protein
MKTWILIVLFPVFTATPDKGEYRKIWVFNTEQECMDTSLHLQIELIERDVVGRSMCIPSTNFPVWHKTARE